MTSRLLSAAATLSLFLAGQATAAPALYPANGCVSTKQKDAAAYCAGVFKAWSKYETTQDAGKRDATIGRVGGKLDTLWSRAETVSAGAGSDCADTTLGAPALRAAIDSAAAAIVGDVNSGLDLGNKDDAQCGARLLRLAGAKCHALLGAESKFINDPSADPSRGGRDAAELRARAQFATGFFRTLHKGCPTNATVSAVEAAVDDVVASTVRDTTISPNVDDTQFTTYSPTGPIQYLGKTLNPTCVKDTPYAFFAKRGFVNAPVVEKWAREHFVDPNEVFVTGSSAGAYGAWFHAPLLHETWPASRFQVLADAGNGVITQDFLNNYFPNWNFVGNIPPEFPEIKDIIENGGGIPAYTEFVAGHFPKTRWAHYASAYDGGF